MSDIIKDSKDLGSKAFDFNHYYNRTKEDILYFKSVSDNLSNKLDQLTSFIFHAKSQISSYCQDDKESINSIGNTDQNPNTDYNFPL